MFDTKSRQSLVTDSQFVLENSTFKVIRTNDDKSRTRPDETVHKFVCRITESSSFNWFIMGVIFLNSIFIAAETDHSLKADKRLDLIFEVADLLFLTIYTVEFLLKIYAEPKSYWKNSYNIFDFIILVISYVQLLLDSLNMTGSEFTFVRVLRAARAMRALRTVSFIRGLQVLVTALLDTLRKSVINIVMLLLLLMYLFAIMGYYFFGYNKVSGDRENWGTLGRAMLSLMSYVTVDGWTEIQDRLDDLGMSASQWYTIIFIFLGHFIFTNVFIGVIIMNIHDATENYKKELAAERYATIQRKKEFMLQRQHKEVKEMMEKQRSGNFNNFQDMIKEFKKYLSHDDLCTVTDLCTNLTWIETYMTSLDHYDNTTYRLQRLHFELANRQAAFMERRLANKMQ